MKGIRRFLHSQFCLQCALRINPHWLFTDAQLSHRLRKRITWEAVRDGWEKFNARVG